MENNYSSVAQIVSVTVNVASSIPLKLFHCVLICLVKTNVMEQANFIASYSSLSEAFASASANANNVVWIEFSVEFCVEQVLRTKFMFGGILSARLQAILGTLVFSITGS